MTDSGFSSTASQRSTSSIVRPTHIKSFPGSLKSDLVCVPSQRDDKESVKETALPKPCMQYPSNSGKPVIPNRLIYGKNHGGYSPSLSPFSNQEMSPMSSLTYDFKDLSTSHNSAATPRKRLSLSSVSSLDSPHPSSSSCFGYNSLNQTSPLPTSMPSASTADDRAVFAQGNDSHVTSGLRRLILVRNCYGKQRTIRVPVSNISKSRPIHSSDSQKCSVFRPIEAEGAIADAHNLVQDDKENRRNVKSLCVQQMGEDSSTTHKRLRSLPQSKGRARLHGVKDDRGRLADKENDPKLMRSKSRTAGGAGCMDSPIDLPESFSPIGGGKIHKHLQNQGLGNMMSSPLISSFKHGKSSAFKLVSPTEATKRQVLGTIDGNIPMQNLSPSRHVKSSGQKRMLDESITSAGGTVARKRKCSKSLNAKSAFLQERKTKSADAITSGRPLPTFTDPASPLTSRYFTCRPISAPVLMGSDDDDDYVLSHSSLCSRDSDDEELKCGSGEEDFSSVSCREDEIESMMSENIKEFTSYEAGRLSTDAPSAIDGLMSGPLLLNQTSGNESTALPTDTHDSVGALGCGRNNTVARKPRELFRSPSAPPLVPSRRCLMKLKRGMRNCDRLPDEGTPVSIKRPRTFASLSDDSNSSKLVDPGLNRSRSYNELDVMKAVDEGCKDRNLVGDFSRQCTLSTVPGRQQDLKYISAGTLVEALRNKHETEMMEIVDCRYTYEYDGGHISGAHNIYTQDQLVERYFNCSKPLWARARQHQAQTGDLRPHILVFHCEFSSERGPKLARYLRNYDRKLNHHNYPKLHYPEIYILKDGYKEFYRLMKEHCEPCGYIPMCHQDYASELRKFRVKSKTWAGERSKQGLFSRLKNQ